MATASGGADYSPSDSGSRFRALDEYFPPLQKRQRKRNLQTIDPRTGFVLLDKQLGEFYVMKNADNHNSLDKVSCFFIGKALNNHIGDGHITKRTRDGNLLIKCKNDTQAKKLLNLNQQLFGDKYKVIVEEHDKLNSVQGLIYCWDSKYLSEDEILDGLKDEKVTAVHKIKKQVNGVLTNTALCILTFKRSVLPETIKFGFHEVLVKPYIPNPLRCLNCFRFGHSRKVCKNDRVCANCSEKFDEHHECSSQTKCVNCRGPHSSLDKTCPRFVRESSIQKIKIQDKISYFEARKKFQSFYPRDNTNNVEQNQTYSEATKNTSGSSKQSHATFTFTAKPKSNVLLSESSNTLTHENSSSNKQMNTSLSMNISDERITNDQSNNLASVESSQSLAHNTTNTLTNSTMSVKAQSPQTRRSTRSNTYLSPSGGAISKHSKSTDHIDIDST